MGAKNRRVIIYVLTILTSTTSDGAREEVSFSPAMDDWLKVYVLDNAVCSAGKLHLQNRESVVTIQLNIVMIAEKEKRQN